MTAHPSRLGSNVPSLLIILGAPNDSQGMLSPIALGRARSAIHEYGRRPGSKIIVTGGYGRHFNTTDKPHAHYVARFLLDHGIAAQDMISVTTTSNTVDDARLSMPVVAQFDARLLCVITSDFHQERAGLIFRALYPNHAVEVIGDPVALTPEDHRRVSEHEAGAIQRLRAQGGVVVEVDDLTQRWPLRDPAP